MKVYLDNDMVSSIARGDMPEDVEGALMQLLELKDVGSLELVTSAGKSALCSNCPADRCSAYPFLH